MLIRDGFSKVQTVLSDHKCQELWTLLQYAQGAERVTRHDIIRYRRTAEKHVGQDDHLYRIQWVSPFHLSCGSGIYRLLIRTGRRRVSVCL